jgi:hypothetical protein
LVPKREAEELRGKHDERVEALKEKHESFRLKLRDDGEERTECMGSALENKLAVLQHAHELSMSTLQVGGHMAPLICTAVT